MRNSHTAPLEVLSEKSNGPFATEPYEAGWADEALVLVYIRELYGPAPALQLQAQISADGVRWLDHACAPLRITQTGGWSLTLLHFGNWLRFAGDVAGGPDDGSPGCVLDLYLVLKG